jgi:hypothetical protein
LTDSGHPLTIPPAGQPPAQLAFLLFLLQAPNATYRVLLAPMLVAVALLASACEREAPIERTPGTATSSHVPMISPRHVLMQDL